MGTHINFHCTAVDLLTVGDWQSDKSDEKKRLFSQYNGWLLVLFKFRFVLEGFYQNDGRYGYTHQGMLIAGRERRIDGNDETREYE